MFKTLLDDELCGLAFKIVKEFLETEPIHEEVAATSRGELVRLLSNCVEIKAMCMWMGTTVKSRRIYCSCSDI